VCDRLPAGLVFARANRPPHMRAGRQCWDVARLAAGRAVTIRLTAQPAGGARKALRNVAVAGVEGAPALDVRSSPVVRVGRTAGRARPGGVTGWAWSACSGRGASPASRPPAPRSWRPRPPRRRCGRPARTARPSRGSSRPRPLSLTSLSRVLRDYGGGPGRIAIHGRDGASLRNPLGTARSHGCIRVADRDVLWLARRIPPGTPVEIRN
jgi:L,D-transpeptidase catalytic domain